MPVDTVIKLDSTIRLSETDKRLRCNQRSQQTTTAHIIVRKSAYHRYSTNGATKGQIFVWYSEDVVQLHKNLSG